MYKLIATLNCLYFFLSQLILYCIKTISLYRDDLPESAYKYQLLGLNLLRLLAQNKLSDFHTVRMFL